MRSKIILIFILVLGGLSLKGEIIEKPPFNVCWLSLFGSFEHDAGVYLCDDLKYGRSEVDSGGFIERGTATMRVVGVLRGTKRSKLVLPYCCGWAFSDGPPIWPTFDEIGNKRILCVVVPEGEDTSAPKLAGVNEAASKVIVVGNGAAIREMKGLCRLYDSPITPKFTRALREAVESPLPTVRDFALEEVIMKLGRTLPDEAVKIIQSRAGEYREGGDHPKIVADPLCAENLAFYQQHADRADLFEADFICYVIGNGFLSIVPDEKFCTFLCRCLVVLAQSESSTIRAKAIRTLANGISFYDCAPNLHFRPLDGLNSSEKKSLAATLDRESNITDTNILANIQLIRGRL